MLGQYVNNHKAVKNPQVNTSTAFLTNGRDTIQVALEVINPVTAKKYLQMSAGNRSPRKRNVDAYVKSMLEKQWHLTGQPLIFNENDILIDGHHRLMACIEANTDFPTLVVRNVRKSGLTSIDIGGKRSVGDQLAFIDNNYTSTNIVASVYRRIYGYKNKHVKVLLSEREMVNYIEESKGIYCDSALYQAANKQRMNGCVIATAAFILKDSNAPKTDEFFHKLITGEMLSIGDPIYTLRTRLIMESKRHVDAHNWIVSSVIRAYNYWISGKRMDKIQLLTHTYTDPKF